MSYDPDDHDLRIVTREELEAGNESVVEDDDDLAAGNRPSVGDVVATLNEGRVRAAELVGLSDPSAPDLAMFRAAWPTFPASVRSTVVTELAEMSEERVDLLFGRVFRLALEDPEAAVRQIAVGGLWEDEGGDMLALLLAVVKDDSSVDVRGAAAAGLLRFAERAELGELDSRSGDQVRHVLFAVATDVGQDWHLRRRAAESASVFSSDERLPDLIRDLYDEDELGLRATAVFAMGRSYDPRWLQTIIDEFENDDAEIRYEAARAAGNLGDVTALPGLSELASVDDDPEVRQAAIAAVGAIGGAGAVRVLQRLGEEAPDGDVEAIDDALVEAAARDDPLSFGVDID